MIAIVSMVVDHLGLFFFPQFFTLRIIGRLAFPLFAWFIANGAQYTRNVKVYFLRLFVLALATQLPYWYSFHLTDIPPNLNAVFTLCLGLAAIMVMRQVSNRWLWIVATLACATLAATLHADYGAEGVLSIVAFYVFRKDFRSVVMSQIVIIGMLPMLVFHLQSKGIVDLSRVYFDSSIEYVGLLSLFVIYAYNHEPGARAKSLFYSFYFLQFVAIALVSMALASFHPVVRMLAAKNVAMVFMENPTQDVDRCKQDNAKVIAALHQKCPYCAVTFSACQERSAPSWRRLVKNQSDTLFSVRTESSRVFIEAVPSVAAKICQEMVTQINAQKRQHATCIPPRNYAQRVSS